MVEAANIFTARGHNRFPRARLVNRGQDTQITLRDGSKIVLKGVVHVDAVFVAGGMLATSKASPIGPDIRGDGEPPHRRRNGGESLGGIAE